MRTWECVWADPWVCTRVSKHVGTCVLLRYATNAGYLLVSVTFVGLLVIIIAFVVILSPFPLPILSPTTLGPTSPASSFPVEDHLVGTSTLDHNRRVVAKPTIDVRQRQICLSACSPLPVPCATKNSHLVSYTHTTLARNHTSLPPPPRTHPCLYLIAIAVLAINSLSRAHSWACPNRR